MAAMVAPIISLPTDIQRVNLSSHRTTRPYGVKPPKNSYIPHRLRGYDSGLETRQIYNSFPAPVLPTKLPTETDDKGLGCQTGQKDEFNRVARNDAPVESSSSNHRTTTSPYLSPTVSPCSSSPTLNSASVPPSEKSVTLKIPCSKFRLGDRYSAVRVVYAINNDRNRSQDTLSVHYPDPSDMEEEEEEREVEESRRYSYEASRGFTKFGNQAKHQQDLVVSAFSGNLFQPPGHTVQDHHRHNNKHQRCCRFPPVGSCFFFLGFIVMPFWWLGSVYLPRPRERAKGADYDWRKRNRIATVYGLIGAVLVVGIFVVAVTRFRARRSTL